MGTKEPLAVGGRFIYIRRFSGILFILIAILASQIPPSVSIAATSPNTIGYQGYIQQSGTPVTGTENFTFALYSVTSGGSALWTETQNNVPVTGGYFSVSLGTQTPFPSTLDFSQSYYLEVTINGTTLAPRQSLDAVPFAHVAYGVVQSTTAPAAPSNGSTYFNPTGSGTFYVYDANTGWTALATTTNSGASTTPSIVNLATGVTGTLPAANGGTGLAGSVGLGILVGDGNGGWTQVATSSLGLTTTNVAEGANLYFTNARADARIALATSLPSLQTLPGLTLTGTINANGNSITGIPTPVNPTDAANKSYVDTFVQGLTWQAPVIALGSTTPPVSPNTGDRYVVGNNATGAWIGEDRTIATWTGSAWTFATPSRGYTLFVTNISAQYNYNGTSWVPIGSGTNFSSLTGIAAISQGGTGLSSGPLQGQILLGNAAGGYSLVATSSLGFVTPSGVASILAGTTTDAIPQGVTNLYYSNALARAAISSNALGLTYASTTGQFSLASGYIIPTIASTTAWNNGISPWTTNGSNIYRTSGNVGVDNSNPQYPLDVAGTVNAGTYFQNGQLLAYASTTSGNVLLGMGALPIVGTSSYPTNDTAIGVNALNANQGNYNTAIGGGAIKSGQFMSYDSAVGYRALYSGGGTTGDNDAFGYESQYENNSGAANAAFGAQALYSNGTGSNNVALGFDTLQYDTNANNTVAIGATAGAGFSNYSNIGGTYVGFNSGEQLQNGSDYNTLLGFNSGYGITSGSNNIVIGAASSSGNNLTTGSQNILIGASAALPSASGSGQLNIGNFIYGTGLTGTGSTVSNGSLGIGTTTPGAKLAVNGNVLIAGALTGTSGLSLNGAITDTSTATSTLAGGTNITSGCYAVNGVCLTSGTNGLTASGVASIIAATTTDAIAQGSTNLYYSNALARNAISSNVVGLTYSSTTGQLALTSGYTIPTTASTTAWNNGISQWTTNGSTITYSGGNVGIGTSTPGALLAVGGNTLIGGSLTTTGGLSLNGAITDTSTATSTLAGGTNITSGCYAVNGVCITAGSGSGGTSQWTTSGSSIYYSGGNVGIGTSNPSGLLDVGGYGTAGFSGNTTAFIAANQNGIAGLEMKNTNAGTANDFRFAIFDTTGNYTAFAEPGVNNSLSNLFGQARATTAFIFNSGGTSRNLAIGTIGSNDVILGTNNTDRLHITSAGSVGVGTTTPGALFAVNGNALIAGALTGTSGLSLNGAINDTSTATSTLAGGTNITSGCYAVNGVCLTTATGGGLTGTTGQLAYFSGTNTAVGTSAIDIGTNGYVGVGTSSPTAYLTVQNNGSVPAASFTNSGTGSNQFEIWPYLDGTTYLEHSSALNFSSIGSTAAQLTIASGGNVGIGTTSPSYGLVVSNAGVNTGFGLAQEELVGSGSETGLYFLNTSTGGRGYNLISTGNNSGIGQGNFAIVDSTAGAARLTINSIGNIGIGATPSATAGNRLVINGGSNNSHLQFLSGNASDFAEFDIGRAGNDASIDIADGAGNFSTDAVAGDLVVRDDTNGHILFNTNSGGGNSTLAISGAHVSIDTASNDGSTLEVYDSNDTADNFHVRDGNTWIYEGAASSNPYAVIGAYNSATAGSVPLELQSIGGYVGIGTNGQYDNDRLVVNGVGTNGMGINIAAGATGIEIFNNSGTGSYNGVTFFKNGSNAIGGITVSQTAIAYGTGSDARIKQNIATTTDSLAQLMGVQVADFEFKSDPSEQVTGFIAQNLENIFPEAVTTNGDNGLVPLGASSTPWTVDYGRVTPLIVKAVQDIANISSTFETNLVAWLGNAQNGIHDLYTNTSHQKTLCVGDSASGGETCITKTQLDQLLQRTDMTPASSGSTPAPSVSVPVAPVSAPAPVTPPSDASSTPDQVDVPPSSSATSTPTPDSSDTGTADPSTTAPSSDTGESASSTTGT